MNLSPIPGMGPGAVPAIMPSNSSGQTPSDGKGEQNPKLEIGKGKLTKKETNAHEEKGPKPEDLVMKPSPTTLEQRLDQIISAEEVKDLLSMVTGGALPKQKDHKIDIKR